MSTAVSSTSNESRTARHDCQAEVRAFTSIQSLGGAMQRTLQISKRIDAAWFLQFEKALLSYLLFPLQISLLLR